MQMIERKGNDDRQGDTIASFSPSMLRLWVCLSLSDHQLALSSTLLFDSKASPYQYRALPNRSMDI
jgi:hypothetical protein